MDIIASNIIYGSIIGDIAGSTIETTYPEGTWEDIDLEYLLQIGHFTDDTVLTIANVDAILNKADFKKTYKKWGLAYSCQGFSKNFIEKFLKADNPEPIHSSANGAIMMLSPFIALESDRWPEAVKVSHDCIEAYRCADWYVNYGKFLKGDEMLYVVSSPYLSFMAPYEKLCKERHWDMSSIITLRNAAVCLENSKSYEEVIKKALYLGADADTTAAVAGGWAAAKFGVPDKLVNLAKRKLTAEMLEFLN